MDSRHLAEQDTPDHQRINTASSKSHPSRAPCPNHFQDSTTARAVLATILEIISVSGNDLNLAYSNSDRRKCPMLKCFHVSETPMEQILHVISCVEASKGEIQCWTCHKCHDFKKWHAMCNTLKSPVELLRRLSSRKRGNYTSAGEPSGTKRGKITMHDGFAITSPQESRDIENAWPQEMEDSPGLLPQFASQNAALELDAAFNVPMATQARNHEMARPLPTPPSTRDNSWSEGSQDLVAYGDAKVVTHSSEQPPPYIVSPQTTVDQYQLQDNVTDSLRLGIPPVQYIQEPNYMESPEDMEADEALWADHTAFGEAQDAHINLQFLPPAPNTTTPVQYASPSEKSASIFSSSFPTSRMPNLHMRKQNTWPMQLDGSVDIPAPPPFEHQQRRTTDDVPGFHTGQNFQAATASQQDAGARLLVQRQVSFDAGTQDSITVGVPAREIHQTGRLPPDDTHQLPSQRQHPARRGAREQQQHALQQQQQEYEECTRCGQQFRGIPKNRRQHLKRHVASKHGDVRFRCGRQNCRRSYNRVDNLHDHERKCHGFVHPHHPHHHQQQQQQQQSGGGTAGGRDGGGAGWSSYSSSSETIAELAAGDVDVRERPSAAADAAESVAGGGFATHHHHRQQDPGASMETHLAVYGYPMPTPQDGHGWSHHRAGVSDDDTRHLGGRRRRGPAGMTIDEDGWDVIMAGVSGGQAGMEEAGPPDDDGHDELAPRPLDLPCVSWRAI